MVARTLFDDVEVLTDNWSLAEVMQRLERRRELEASENVAEPGQRRATRASLVDLLERPKADDEHEQNDPNPADKGCEFLGLGAAAAIAATMLRNAPQVSNTGGMNSQTEEIEPEKGKDILLPPHKYLYRPSPKNFVERQQEHWTERDPKLFASIPQGGGGIDWMLAGAYGHLNERGRALVMSLKHAKKHMGKKVGAQAACAEAGLHLETMRHRESMTFHHPFLQDKALNLSFGVSGKGRNYQPLILHCEGICVTFGRIEDSEGTQGTRGPVATVQITGSTFLKLGETAAFNLAKQVMESLGIVISNLRCMRLDVCVDLPGATVDDMMRHYFAGNKVQAARRSKPRMVFNPQTLKCEYFALKSGSTMMRIYDKVQECLDKDPGGDRMAMMEQNRWGGPQEKAVRVEFQFNMGKNRAKRYNSFRELFEGMADLIGWATNNWFRLCTVGTDRTHTARYKGVETICDEWLRVLHAFAFWSGRLDRRHKPPRVQTRPCQHMINGAIGTFAAALGRQGIVPVDDVTAFGILAGWKGPNALAERCRDVAIEHMATRGVDMRNVTVRSTEDDRYFQQLRSVHGAFVFQQNGGWGGADVPF